jgi:hypothetical protein
VTGQGSRRQASRRVASGGDGQQALGSDELARESRHTSSFDRLRVGPPSTCDRGSGGLLALDRGSSGLLSDDEQER